MMQAHFAATQAQLASLQAQLAQLGVPVVPAAALAIVQATASARV